MFVLLLSFLPSSPERAIQPIGSTYTPPLLHARTWLCFQGHPTATKVHPCTRPCCAPVSAPAAPSAKSQRPLLQPLLHPCPLLRPIHQHLSLQQPTTHLQSQGVCAARAQTRSKWAPPH